MGILDDILNTAKSEATYKVGQKVRQEVDKAASAVVGGQGGAKCPKCGKGIADPNLKFCTACGAALSLTCSKCGASVPVGTKFCGKCGTALGST